jgi:hypothetical protein
MTQWTEGTLFDNIDKFAHSLGYENANIAITLGMVPWQSVADRDSFIRAITGQDPQGGDGNYLSDINKKGGNK